MFRTIRCTCHNAEVSAEHFQGNLYKDAQGHWHSRLAESDENKLLRCSQEAEQAVIEAREAEATEEQSQESEPQELDEVFDEEKEPVASDVNEFLNLLELGEQHNEQQ
jgi:hypothetical protein